MIFLLFSTFEGGRGHFMANGHFVNSSHSESGVLLGGNKCNLCNLGISTIFDQVSGHLRYSQIALRHLHRHSMMLEVVK